jgi:hypothetical protein
MGSPGRGHDVATGSEVGLYVQRRVKTFPDSQQTPDFGTFDDQRARHRKVHGNATYDDGPSHRAGAFGAIQDAIERLARTGGSPASRAAVFARRAAPGSL